MSNELNLAAEHRDDQGKGASRRLRREDKIPAILYGDNKEPTSLSVSKHRIAKLITNPSFFSQIIDLEINGEVTETILRDIQRHPAREDVLHIDFQRITRGQEISVSVPLNYLNTESAEGVKAGGVLSINAIEIEVTCRPSKIPTGIDVDVAEMNIGDAIHLSEISFPEGVRAAAFDSGEANDITLVVVNAPRGTAEEEESETAVEESPETNETEES